MWARVPVSELYKLPLLNYRKIVTEDGFTLYDHQSEDFTIIVDEEGPDRGWQKKKPRLFILIAWMTSRSFNPPQ